MRDLSLDERRQILLDCMVMPSRKVRGKWSVSPNTLSHIRFFHGKSHAKARGYYHKDLLGDAMDPYMERIRSIKASGGTSIEASVATGIPLERVNKLWPKLS